MGKSDPKHKERAGWLMFALTLGAAVAYLLVWRLLPADDGCGPPGHSTAGRVLEIAPFVLPFAAAGISSQSG